VAHLLAIVSMKNAPHALYILLLHHWYRAPVQRRRLHKHGGGRAPNFYKWLGTGGVAKQIIPQKYPPDNIVRAKSIRGMI